MRNAIATDRRASAHGGGGVIDNEAEQPIRLCGPTGAYRADWFRLAADTAAPGLWQ
jgi:hypothetical protein